MLQQPSALAAVAAEEKMSQDREQYVHKPFLRSHAAVGW